MARPTASKKPLARTGPEPHPSWQERRDWLRARLGQQLQKDVSPEEAEAHFSGMPPHYWDRVGEEELLWGLKSVHGFLELVARTDVAPTTPFMDVRHLPELGQSRVILCTWDRQGLLAKAAAAFSALRLNIVRADAFTRADNIVLDVFSVADLDPHGEPRQSRWKEAFFLLEGALSEPPRFASIWMCSRHKYIDSPPPSQPCIAIDNQTSETDTLVEIGAPDRLGLLYDILQTIADSDLNVTEARIETRDNFAQDTIHVRDAEGRKLIDPGRLAQLRQRLESALVLKE